MRRQLFRRNNLPGDEETLIACLITRYMFFSITPEEHDRLDEWVAANDANMLLFETLTDSWKTEQALYQFRNAKFFLPGSLKKIMGNLIA